MPKNLKNHDSGSSTDECSIQLAKKHMVENDITINDENKNACENENNKDNKNENNKDNKNENNKDNKIECTENNKDNKHECNEINKNNNSNQKSTKKTDAQKGQEKLRRSEDCFNKLQSLHWYKPRASKATEFDQVLQSKSVCTYTPILTYHIIPLILSQQTYIQYSENILPILHKKKKKKHTKKKK